MVQNSARAMAKHALRRLGLVPSGSLDRLQTRLDRTIAELERARAERAAVDRRAAELERLLDKRAAELQQQSTRQIQVLEQEHQRQVAGLERKLTELEDDHRRRLGELQRQHAQEVADLKEQERQLVEAAERHRREYAEAEERFEERLAERLVDVDQQHRQRVMKIAQDTNTARQELMMVEVKLDILEGAINMLDRRTRMAGTLPVPPLQPVARQSTEAPSLSPDATVRAELDSAASTEPSEREAETDATSPLM